MSTRHGILRMAERGVTQEMAEAWVKTGKALQQSGDKILYITKHGAIVVNSSGKVITAYTNINFDTNMKDVVKRLFGK